MINFSEFKKYFLFSLIGSLILSAVVAVITVLTGEFNELTARVLWTLFSVVTHSLISLFFIWDDERKDTFRRLSFFINVVFVLIVLSFLTSLFNIWEIMDHEWVSKLYQTYFIVAFTALHGDILSKAAGKKNYMDKIILANYVFIGLVSFMSQLTIYCENFVRTIGEMFYRILGAVGIIDGTLSILTIIFYKLYIHNNPGSKAIQGKKNSDFPVGTWLLIIAGILIMFILGSMFISGFYVAKDYDRPNNKTINNSKHP